VLPIREGQKVQKHYPRRPRLQRSAAWSGGITLADNKTTGFTAREALFYHETIRRVKSKSSPRTDGDTARLSLAYSPGVAAPVRAIADDPANAAKYTAREDLVAVISSRTLKSWEWAI
jgi:hypothetical protein